MNPLSGYVHTGEDDRYMGIVAPRGAMRSSDIEPVEVGAVYHFVFLC
jgi:hypothetical protein